MRAPEWREARSARRTRGNGYGVLAGPGVAVPPGRCRSGNGQGFAGKPVAGEWDRQNGLWYSPKVVW